MPAALHLFLPPGRASQFGEIDVDSDLVSVREDLAPGDEQILMLNNGCLCCTVRDDLVQMLTKLVRRPLKTRPTCSGFRVCVSLLHQHAVSFNN